MRDGWLTDPDGTPYPPEPWHLGGDLLLSWFRPPAATLPPAALAHFPNGHRPLSVGGRLSVGVTAVRYTTSGVLDYDELVVAVATTRGKVTIPQIWVDSPESRAGGRDLWGIPKDLARFTRTDTTVRIDDWAHLTFRTGRTLVPGLRRIALPTAQRWEGTDRISTNVVLTRVKALQATWLLDPDGPLGWLSDQQPTLSLALTDASIAFGTKVKRTAAAA